LFRLSYIFNILRIISIYYNILHIFYKHFDIKAELPAVGDNGTDVNASFSGDGSLGGLSSQATGSETFNSSQGGGTSNGTLKLEKVEQP